MRDPGLRMGATHQMAASAGNFTRAGLPSDVSPLAMFFALVLSFFVILCAVSMINALSRPVEPEDRGVELEDDL